MRPEKESCLVEVLDRLLNKGAVLNADLIISVAGIPMIGLNLRAVLASIETMLDYGMMEAWDKNTREWYSSHGIPLRDHFLEGEEVIFTAFGYLWQDQGIVSSWLPGIWHITTKRLFLWRRSPGEIAFEIPLYEIGIFEEKQSDDRSPENRIELNITCSRGTSRIYLPDLQEFTKSLEGALLTSRTVAA